MTTNDYFQHARKLGAFSASDCLELARQAAELDKAAEIKKLVPPSIVGTEYAYGSMCTFSRGITVY